MNLKTFAVATLFIAGTAGFTFAQAANPPAAQGQGGQGGGRQRGQGGQGGQAWGGGRGGMQATDNLDTMSQQLTDLTDDQKTKLKTAIDAMDQDMQDWRSDVQDAMQNARSAGQDATARDKMRTEMQKLMQDRDKIVSDGEIKIDAILTPDQAAKWESYKLQQTATQRLGALSLTDDEKTKVVGLADDTGKQIATAKDAATADTAKGHFWKQIIDTVLTDAQIQQYFNNPGMGMLGGMMGQGGGGRGQRGQGGGGQGGGQNQGGQGNAGQNPRPGN